jgi:nucleoid-associated protein YgaU
MGLLSFIKGAGEKLFGTKETQEAHAEIATKPDDNVLRARVAVLNNKAANAIADYIKGQGLDVQGLHVEFDGATATAKVQGVAANTPVREKAVLCCGNVNGVEKVDDQLTVNAIAMQAEKEQQESQFYTVEKGDTLSKIAKHFYHDAMKYPVIFEANKPMLKDPDLIYPGQSLRIPPLAPTKAA